MKKEVQKKLSFVLFVMSIFYAGTALTVFQSYIWMACVAGVVLLVTSVLFVLSQENEDSSASEKTTELLIGDRLAELMRGNEKAEKGVYIAVKKQHEALESGLAALQEQIAELIKVQENAVKTLVMYNKENAKQLALSEREELGRLRETLKQVQQGEKAFDSVSSVVEAVREMSRRLYEELHENGEAVLAELGATVDGLEEVKGIVKDLCANGSAIVERNAVTPMVSPVVEQEEVFIQETEEEPEAVFSPEPVEEPEGMVIPEPELKEETPEDAPASSGVDLSDSNKTLSADDIAALFASMGN